MKFKKFVKSFKFLVFFLPIEKPLFKSIDWKLKITIPTINW